MSEAKHTPGPWQTSPAAFVFDDTKGRRVADCGNKLIPLDQQLANTLLIAAAPDLLEALEEVARLPVATIFPDGPCIEYDLMTQVRAAITKAKGETP